VNAWLEHRHHVAAPEKCDTGRSPPPSALPRISHRLHIFMVAGEQPAGSTQAGLDLVGNQQDVMPRQMRWHSARYPCGGTMMPPSPGSVRPETQRCRVMALSSALALPKGTSLKPRGNGRSRRDTSFGGHATIAIERP